MTDNYQTCNSSTLSDSNCSLMFYFRTVIRIGEVLGISCLLQMYTSLWSITCCMAFNIQNSWGLQGWGNLLRLSNFVALINAYFSESCFLFTFEELILYISCLSSFNLYSFLVFFLPLYLLWVIVLPLY